MPDRITPDCPVTKEHVEEILQGYFNFKTTLAKAEGVTISKGLGFTSDIIRVQLKWNENNGVLPSTVIVKAPKLEHISSMMEQFNSKNSNDAVDVGARFVPIIHETECNAYKYLMIDRPLPIPTIYGYRLITDTHPGLIMMEDLGQRAGLVDNIATGLSMGQWQSIVQCLADLHAWSLTTDAPWREQITADFTSYRDVYASFATNALASLQSLKQQYPDYFAEVDEERCTQALDVENIIAKNMLYKDIMPAVLQHGDTWTNNIMFLKRPDGTLSDQVAAFLDWQISVRGCGIYDFTRLECICINHNLRRANAKTMLKMYFDRLKSKVGDELSATYEQIEYIYHESMAINAIINLLWTDFILQNIVQVNDDERGQRKTEMLGRIKACYEDAAMYYGWRNETDT